MEQKAFASIPRYMVLCACSFAVILTAMAVLGALLELFTWFQLGMALWLTACYAHFALALEDQVRLERKFLGWFWRF